VYNRLHCSSSIGMIPAMRKCDGAKSLKRNDISKPSSGIIREGSFGFDFIDILLCYFPTFAAMVVAQSVDKETIRSYLPYCSGDTGSPLSAVGRR
jgi:hypothetical protein